MCGFVIGLAGSNALYHAKLDWIKVWTCRLRTVLMKGSFSTFDSVKLSLLNRTGNKIRSCFLFPFKELALLAIEDRSKTKRENRVITRDCCKRGGTIEGKGFIMDL